MLLLVRDSFYGAGIIPILSFLSYELCQLRDFSLRQAQDRHPFQGFEMTSWEAVLLHVPLPAPSTLLRIWKSESPAQKCHVQHVR